MSAPDERAAWEDAALRVHDEVAFALGHPLGGQAEDALCDSVIREITDALATHARRLENMTAEKAQLRLVIENVKEQARELERRLEEARAALSDMIGLASGLEEDDPWFGEQRGAKEAIRRASEVLASLSPPTDGRLLTWLD